MTLPSTEELVAGVQGVFESFVEAIKAALKQYVDALAAIVNGLLGIAPLDE